MDHLIETLGMPITRLLNQKDQFFLGYVLLGLVFGGMWYALKSFRRGPKAMWRRGRTYIRLLFSKKVLAHPSTWLDVKLFFASSLLMATGWLTFFISGEKLSGGTQATLTMLFGPSAFHTEPNLVLSIFISVGAVLAMELGYWLAHYTMHYSQSMWEFHKLHHSAKVMSPLTEWRQHPVELALFPMTLTFFIAPFYGAVGYLFGDSCRPVEWLQLNLMLLIFFVTVVHLHHSHFWLPTRGIWGKLILSPAHHLVHHSQDPKHFNKNLGFVLGVWDWLFGTLYVPEHYEKISFGIGKESAEHTGVLKSYWLPFRNLWQRSVRRRKKRRALAKTPITAQKS